MFFPSKRWQCHETIETYLWGILLNNEFPTELVKTFYFIFYRVLTYMNLFISLY